MHLHHYFWQTKAMVGSQLDLCPCKLNWKVYTCWVFQGFVGSSYIRHEPKSTPKNSYLIFGIYMETFLVTSRMYLAFLSTCKACSLFGQIPLNHPYLHQSIYRLIQATQFNYCVKFIYSSNCHRTKTDSTIHACYGISVLYLIVYISISEVMVVQ